MSLPKRLMARSTKNMTLSLPKNFIAEVPTGNSEFIYLGPRCLRQVWEVWRFLTDTCLMQFSVTFLMQGHRVLNSYDSEEADQLLCDAIEARFPRRNVLPSCAAIALLFCITVRPLLEDGTSRPVVHGKRTSTISQQPTSHVRVSGLGYPFRP